MVFQSAFNKSSIYEVLHTLNTLLRNSGVMGFHRILVQLTWVGVISSVMAATDTQFPSALPNCPDRCGDLQIPYPFGLTEGCYLNETKGSTKFSIFCDNSSGKPETKTGDFLVTNISVQESQIEIMMDNNID